MLPWLGFVPDQAPGVPPVTVARLADQLNLNPGELRSYGRRAKTRTEHLGPAGILAKGAMSPELPIGIGQFMATYHHTVIHQR